MRVTEPAPVQLGKGAIVAYLVVVAAGYASLLNIISEYEAWQLVLLVVLGVVYVGSGLGGDTWCDRTFPRFSKAIFFTFQLVVGGLIVYLGRSGLIGLVMFPLASQAAASLTLRWMAIVAGAIVAVLVLPVAYFAGAQAAVPAAMSYSAGILFVVVFTQVAVSEQRLRTEAERLAKELGAANEQLRAYAVQVEELAVARERNRMAREIHDSLGHYLTAVNMQLEAARAVLASDPARAQDAMSKAQALTREGLADVRRSVAALRAGPAEDRPLGEALAALVRESDAAGVPATLDVRGTPRSLAPAAQLTLYRAAQEGLTNVRKHAGAAHARLELDFRGDGSVVLSVTDDGAGASANGQGFGLLGVRERVEFLGGSVRTESRTGEGYALTVTLPG